MIRFSSNCDSMLKAYLLSKLTGDQILSEGSEDLLFFRGDAVIDTAGYQLEDLIVQYQDYFMKNIRWLSSHKGNELKYRISTALRHTAPDKHTAVFKALEDAFSKGAGYCLEGASENSKRLRHLCSEVLHEVYRMMGFIRFVPGGDKCLVASPKLYFDTVDLILREFQNRYPYHRIVLVTEEGAMAIENKKLFEADRAYYNKFLEDDSFGQVWEEYYRSQYIPSRKNLKLAASRIPKKYWDWMPEGKILRDEEKK